MLGEEGRSSLSSIISVSGVAKSSDGRGISGKCVLTLPIAVNGFTRCLLTLIVRPFLIRSKVPLENTLLMRYGPSHLSSIFSLVLRKRRLSRNTNCPGANSVSFTLSSCLCLYSLDLVKAFLSAVCLFRNKCLRRSLVEL